MAGQGRDENIGGVEPRSIILNLFAILVVVLMVAITAQVVCSFLDFNPIVVFDSSWPVLGGAVTLNSLLDFQWHLLAVIALLPAGIVWRMDRHVRVDFLYAQQSYRRKALVELTGHLLFTAPFLFLCLPAAWSFVVSAYTSGQGSRNDGLNDLFLIKSALPAGLGLLALVLVVDVVQKIREVRKP